MGDDAITPSIADIFKAVLARRAAGQLAGRTVRITDAVVTVRDPAVSVDQDALNEGALSSGGPKDLPPAALAGSLILGIERMRSQKWVYARVKGFVDQNEFSAYDTHRYSGRVSEANILATVMSAMELAADDAQRAASNKPGDAK